MSEPLFSCSFGDCADYCSYPASDLKLWEGKPICKGCFESGDIQNYDEETDVYTHFHDLERFVPEAEKIIADRDATIKALREGINVLKTYMTGAAREYADKLLEGTADASE